MRMQYGVPESAGISSLQLTKKSIQLPNQESVPVHTRGVKL